MEQSSNDTKEKYYDLYPYDNNLFNYSHRILGDATGEMGTFRNSTLETSEYNIPIGSWYNDSGWFVHSSKQWFYRGYDLYNGISSGIFSFGSAYGHALSDYGYRIVLAI